MNKEEIEQELLKYTTKVVDEDNPMIVSYKIKEVYRRAYRQNFVNKGWQITSWTKVKNSG